MNPEERRIRMSPRNSVHMKTIINKRMMKIDDKVSISTDPKGAADPKNAADPKSTTNKIAI